MCKRCPSECHVRNFRLLLVWKKNYVSSLKLLPIRLISFPRKFLESFYWVFCTFIVASIKVAIFMSSPFAPSHPFYRTKNSMVFLVLQSIYAPDLGIHRDNFIFLVKTFCGPYTLILSGSNIDKAIWSSLCINISSRRTHLKEWFFRMKVNISEYTPISLWSPERCFDKFSKCLFGFKCENVT